VLSLSHHLFFFCIFLALYLHISEIFTNFAPVFVRMHYKGAHTYTQEQINYDERILIIDRSAGSGADIIAKGWKENHWARPTIKDSYFPSEETELILDLLKEGDQGTTQTTTQKQKGLLSRIGPDKGGHREIIDK
jgi:hypothetical protein